MLDFCFQCKRNSEKDFGHLLKYVKYYPQVAVTSMFFLQKSMFWLKLILNHVLAVF